MDSLFRSGHVNYLLRRPLRIRSSVAGRVRTESNERVFGIIRERHQFTVVPADVYHSLFKQDRSVQIEITKISARAVLSRVHR